MNERTKQEAQAFCDALNKAPTEQLITLRERSFAHFTSLIENREGEEAQSVWDGIEKLDQVINHRGKKAVVS